MAASQILGTGASRDSIRARLRTGRLVAIHAGVYAVNPSRLTTRGRWMAAVLAAGPGALLSHESAAELLSLRKPSSIIHVVKRRGMNRRFRLGEGYGQVVAHSTRRLERGEAARVAGIPVTSFVRTTIDLAGRLDRRRLDDHLAEADRLGLMRLRDLRLELDRWPGRKGIASLRRVLRDWYPLTGEEMSRFERLFVDAMVGAGAPPPQVNPLLEDHLIDCLWPQFKVMIELDGCTYHADPATQGRDARRDVKHTLMGYQVNRFTWPQFRDGRPEVIDLALALLRNRGWSGSN